MHLPSSSVSARFTPIARQHAALAVASVCLLAAAPASGESLYGIHWWGNSYSGPVDGTPAQLLDSQTRGGWDLEIAHTHNEFFWSAEWLRPLYQDLRQNKNVSTITRVGYRFGDTVPSPTSPDYAGWAGNVAGVVSHLAAYGNVWQVGNECNITGEGTGWVNSQITPAGYAQIYRSVRSTVRSTAAVSPLGQHQMLIAPPSPGGVIPGVRWMDGNAWLGQTIDAIAAGGSINDIDGIALHAYGGSVAEFRRSVAEQMALIRSKGLGHVPVYLTEFNRYSEPGAAAAQEAAAADFVRGAYEVLNEWNQRPGNQNIRAATWFVYDADQTAGGGWNGYSIEYWKAHGNPAGHPGDLYTAFEQAVDRGYAAGLTGTRPLPAGVTIFDDFETGDGRFNAPITQGATGITAASSKSRIADHSFTQSYAQRLSIVDSPAEPRGHYLRYLSGVGSPAQNATITLSDTADDGAIGLWLRTGAVSDPLAPLTVQIVLDSGAGAGTLTDAGIPRTIAADGQWHFYEWRFDAPTDWTPLTDIAGAVIAASDGLLPASGPVSIDSVLFRGGNVNVEYFFDAVMINRGGSLASMIPEPGAAGLGLAAGGGVGRRRRD